MIPLSPSAVKCLIVRLRSQMEVFIMSRYSLLHLKNLTQIKTFKKAFTLMETLVVLFVFSLIMHSLTLAILNYQRVDQFIRDDYTPEWHQFLLLLEHELDRYDLVNVTSQQITVTDSTQRFQIVHHNHKIYKTPGHHPYLFNVKSWQLNYQEPFLWITLEFNNQQQFSGQLLIPN